MCESEVAYKNEGLLFELFGVLDELYFLKYVYWIYSYIYTVLLRGEVNFDVLLDFILSYWFNILGSTCLIVIPTVSLDLILVWQSN